MFELVKNPNVNWLGTKKWFVGISVVLLFVGAISVYEEGFNLGIDFAGGTLVTVKFKGTHPPEKDVRAALSEQGIDPGKVVFQSVTDPIRGLANQLLIRLPLRVEAQPAGAPASGSGTDRAPQTASAEEEGAPPAGQSASQETVASTQRPTGPVDVTEQLDAEKRDIEAALQTFNDPGDVAGKDDLNTIGRDRLQNRLVELDPLGLKDQLGQSAASAKYGQYADLIRDYREQESGGLVPRISELKNIPGIPSELVDTMEEHFFAGNARLVSVEIVGPQIGEELRQRAIYVVLASFAGMLLYIAFRFEWIYGVAAVIAVIHDMLITFGVFSLMQWEISLTVVAAFLTLAGYSVNDTIVIFDRVRENLRLRRREDLTKLVNDSINQTLSRTILTSGLTLSAVVFLVVFGGPVLNAFAWALLIGILVGTYSSVAIASPIMVWWQQFQEVRTRRRVASGSRVQQVKRKVVAG